MVSYAHPNRFLLPSFLHVIGRFLVTLVVFDGKIGIVQHLWYQSVVKVVPLDGVIFVHCTDGLDHLLSKERDTGC